MPERVIEKNEVSLNAVKYPILGEVQSVLTSQFAPKVVIGDTSRDSQQGQSVVAWGDWRGGIGLFKMRDPLRAENAGDINRAWWSTCQMRYNGHLVLPQLATLTAASGVTGVYVIGAMGELSNEIYAAFGTPVRKYDNTADSWSATLTTLPANATDALTFRMNNVVYLAFAHTDGYTYSSDGVAWTNDTRDALYLVYWDDRLWGIDNTGLLWWSSQIGVEQDDAQLPLPDGSVNRLFLGRNAQDEVVIFAATTNGLYVHVADNVEWRPTELLLPYHPDNGRGAVRWRDSSYISSGTAVYQYIQGAQSAVVTTMGLDKDDGLPSDQRGVIRFLLPSHNELLALTDGTTAPGSLNNFDSGGLGSHMTAVINPDTGFSFIGGWDGRGWDAKWLSGSATERISAAIVSNAYSTYRLWWAHNERVYFMPLQRDIVNPNEVTTLTYATSGELITPWVNLGSEDVNKLALRLRVELADTSANETVRVDYATNYSTSYTTLGTISSDGITEYPFPNSTTPTGTAFRAIRFRLTFARGSTNTLSPDVLSLTLIAEKRIPPLWGFEFEVDMQKDYHGRSPLQMRSSLLTAMESAALVEFTFRNDTGDTRNFYVRVLAVTGLEETGISERGRTRVMVSER